jgi:hypothetical protein
VGPNVGPEAVSWPASTAAQLDHGTHRNAHCSHEHWLAMIGRVVSQVQSAKANHELAPANSAADVVAPASGPSSQTNCSECAQSVGAAIATVLSHLQSTPSSAGHRPSTGVCPDEHASQRNSPGRGQSQMPVGAEGAGPSSRAWEPASECAPAACSGLPHPSEAPTTAIV